MQVEKSFCKNNNKTFGDHFELEYDTSPLKAGKSPLDSWLTERYAVFQEVDQEIARFTVHHIPWDLEKLEVKKLSLSYPRFQKILAQTPNVAHYSRGVQVVTWPKNIGL